MDIQCRMERDNARLVVFETQRENNCVTKYLIDEYDATAAEKFAIGREYSCVFKADNCVQG